MTAQVVNVMGTMLLLAAAGAQPNKPFFSQQVILASMHQLIGADAFEQRQQNPWDQVGPLQSSLPVLCSCPVQVVCKWRSTWMLCC